MKTIILPYSDNIKLSPTIECQSENYPPALEYQYENYLPALEWQYENYRQP